VLRWELGHVALAQSVGLPICQFVYGGDDDLDAAKGVLVKLLVRRRNRVDGPAFARGETCIRSLH
jgi:hypothetical protein